MKKIIGFITVLSIIFCMTGVYAAEDALNYTITEVQQLVIINNKQIDIDNLNIKAMDSAYAKALEDARLAGDAFGPAAALNNRLLKEVNTMVAASNVEVANRSKVANIRKLRLDAQKQALGIIILNRELQKENQKLAILKEKLKIAQAKKKAGSITENDIIDINYSIESKQNDIEVIKEKIRTAALELKNLLNLPLDDKIINIKDELTYLPLEQVDLEAFLEDSYSSSIDVFQAGENVKSAEKTMELTAVYYKSGDTTYDSNKLSLETARLDLETAKVNLEVEVRNRYNDLMNQKTKVEMADKYLKLCESKVKNLEIRLKSGIISNEAVLDGKDAYCDAVYQKSLEIYNYSVQKAEFLGLAEK